MLDLTDLSEKDAGAMYEWLKNIIISSRYITPGVDTFREIKVKTVAMLRKMLDLDGICGENIAETAKWRECAVHCSAIFVNIAGELIRQWVDRDDDEVNYFPDREVDHPEQKLDDERIVGSGTDDGKDDNVDCSLGVTPGSKPFYCPKPLSKDTIAELEIDYQDMAFCPEHLPAKNRADCVYCHARQQQLFERAISANQKVEQIKTRGARRCTNHWRPRNKFPWNNGFRLSRRRCGMCLRWLSSRASEWRSPTPIARSRDGGRASAKAYRTPSW